MAATDNISGGETLEKVLSRLDALHTRIDSMELGEGSKNPLGKGDSKKDAAKADGKKDEWPDKEEEKDDSAKSDGEKEEEEKDDDAKSDQAPPPPAGGTGATAPPTAPLMADKKKDSKKDAAKSDQDDKADKADDAKSDARADEVGELRKMIESQAEIIKRLDARMRPVSDEEHQQFAEAQGRADSVFAGFGEFAPRPMEGETLLRYRKRLATALKKHSSDWKDVKFSELPENVFSKVEEKVYADAISAAAHPIDLQPGELRELKTVTSAGHAMTKFVGQDSFVKGLGQDARRAKINNFPRGGQPAF